MRILEGSKLHRNFCLKCFYHTVHNQCDQMARMFIQYFAIYNNENSSNSIYNVPKLAENNAKYLMNAFKMAETLQRVAKSGHTVHNATYCEKLSTCQMGFTQRPLSNKPKLEVRCILNFFQISLHGFW